MQKVSVPKSTLSNWLSKEGWSQRIKESLQEKTKNQNKIKVVELNKIRGEKLRQLYKEAGEEAQDDFKKLRYHPLFIAGVMLYWGEGDKVSKNQVRLSNVDPQLIKLFSRFLREVCGVSENKIRLSILIYSDLIPTECRKYWSQNTGLSESSFTKEVTIPSRHKKRRISHGICTITVSSTYLKEKITFWLKILPFTMLLDSYYSVE